MKRLSWNVFAAGIASASAALLPSGFAAPPQDSQQQVAAVSSQAKGSFDVKTVPLAADAKDQEAGLTRFSGAKQYHGDLEATAKVLMLAAGDYTKGNAGYVAIEKVSGSLQGRAGTFDLQHSATLDQGAQQLSIVVVPGTGTGQLEGLRGMLKITVTADGKHSYEFDYTLPAAK